MGKGEALPEIGARVQALKGKSFTGKDSNEYFHENDKAIVQGVGDDQVLVMWSRTGRLGALPTNGLLELVKVLPNKASRRPSREPSAAADSEVAPPDEIVAHSPYKNIDGCYMRRNAKVNGFPAYHNGSEGSASMYLFHSPLGIWMFADHIKGGQQFNTCRSNETDVLELPIESWSRPGQIEAIEALLRPDADMMAKVPSALMMRARYANICGSFERLEEDSDHYPAYRNQAGTYLFHIRRDGAWYLGPDLGSTQRLFGLCEDETPDASLLDAEFWQPPDVNVQVASLPKRVTIASASPKVRGCYRRLGPDFDYYPAFRHDGSGRFLYHLRRRRCWCVSEELGIKEPLEVSASNELVPEGIQFAVEERRGVTEGC